MEKPLSSGLKSDLKPGLKNARHPIIKEKSPQQKHLANLINRLLNDYFGIVTVLAVLTILICSYFFLIQPKYKKIVATINATFNEKNQLAPKYNELSGYKALIESYKAVDQASVDKINGLVPAEYLKEDLFTEIIYLASNKGLAVNSLSIVKDTEATSTAGSISGRAATATASTTSAPQIPKAILPNGIGSFNVKIVLGKVTYPALKTWVQAMENSLRIIDVKTLSFDPKAGTATLEMVTYYLKK